MDVSCYLYFCNYWCLQFRIDDYKALTLKYRDVYHICASSNDTGTFEEKLYQETKTFVETHARDIYKVKGYFYTVYCEARIYKNKGK